MASDPFLITQKEFKYSICSFLGGYVGAALCTDNSYYETIGFLVGGIASSIFSSFYDIYHGINQGPIKAKLVESIHHHIFSTLVGTIIGLVAAEKRVFTFQNSISFYISTYIINLFHKHSNHKLPPTNSIE